MNIARALQKASKEAGWSPAKIAATVGKTEASARAYLKGQAQMGAEASEILRRELPGFAALLDREKAVA